MSSQGSKTKDARFDTRLPKEQKAFFEKAAQLGGFRNLTDFVVIAAQEKAAKIISDQERVIASQKDSEIFFDAVINPKGPNKKLGEAAKEFKDLFS